MHFQSRLKSIILFACLLSQCASAPFRPADTSAFLQGSWQRTGTNCDQDGDCQTKGSALFMLVTENQIYWKKTKDGSTTSESIYRVNVDDRLNITEVESARTYLAKIQYIDDSSFLLSSRQWPEKYEKWQRLK
jgi:hypothetical protein